MANWIGLRAALRRVLLAGAALAAAPALAQAQAIDLTLEQRLVNINGEDRPAVTVNGQFPGPLLRLREGEEAVIRVTNRMREASSIHWHGLILPSSMDGAPGFSAGFVRGVAPGETFEYRFPVRQSGTYWYHAHNLDHEQRGLYAPIIIDPRGPTRSATTASTWCSSPNGRTSAPGACCRISSATPATTTSTAAPWWTCSAT